jgi:biofilm protein TabA
MIIDRLENLRLYAGIHPLMPKIIDYLAHADLSAFLVGRHPIDEDLFVLRDAYVTRPLSECFFEGHRKYGDVHIVLSGTESFGYCQKQMGTFRITAPYSREKDLETYEMTDFMTFPLSKGLFAIVFPDDLHLAKLVAGTPSPVEKAIVKFRL